MSGQKNWEWARLGVLGLAAGWLLHPFANGRMYGSGDAVWYTHMLADYVIQLRAGIFPIYVGQTEYAFNGAVYPLRVAPMYQHLAGLLDLLTFRSLGFFALQHLVVIVCGVAGILASYLTLIRIAPDHRWSAVGFAILYLSCPGLLATIYTQDLYMTWMTVPLAPLAVYGIVRTFRKDDIASQFWLAAPLAALWWAHSPIALWMTLIAAASQIIRLAAVRRSLDPFKRALLGVVIFSALAQYPFVSVAEIQASGTQSTVVGSLTNPGSIPETIRSVFPGILLPLSDHARKLSDLQLGYGFWAVLGCSIAALASARRRDLAVILASCAFLLILVLPIVGLNPFLWEHIPAEIVRITYYWPMQRFYLIVAALLAAAGQITVDAIASRNGRIPMGFAVILAAGCFWSLFEARQFVRAAAERTASLEGSVQAMRPENLSLMDHSYGLFAKLPAYFSNGVDDPREEARLFSPDSELPIPIGSGKIILSGKLVGKVDANPGILDLSPKIHLEAGHRYGLDFTFAQRNLIGILQFTGRSMFREYALPSSGEHLAFGVGPKSSPTVNLWTTAVGDDDVEIRFIPQLAGAKAKDFASFGAFRLREIDPRNEPVDVISLVPFHATIRTNIPALLESPRVFMPGYFATIDGRPDYVDCSKEGLAEVSIPPGIHTVILGFKAPLLLSLSYWVAMLGWAATLAMAFHSRFRSRS
jgi:hypothetical protein